MNRVWFFVFIISWSSIFTASLEQIYSCDINGIDPSFEATNDNCKISHDGDRLLIGVHYIDLVRNKKTIFLPRGCIVEKVAFANKGDFIGMLYTPPGATKKQFKFWEKISGKFYETIVDYDDDKSIEDIESFDFSFNGKLFFLAKLKNGCCGLLATDLGCPARRRVNEINACHWRIRRFKWKSMGYTKVDFLFINTSGEYSLLLSGVDNSSVQISYSFRDNRFSLPTDFFYQPEPEWKFSFSRNNNFWILVGKDLLEVMKYSNDKDDHEIVIDIDEQKGFSICAASFYDRSIHDGVFNLLVRKNDGMFSYLKSEVSFSEAGKSYCLSDHHQNDTHVEIANGIPIPDLGPEVNDWADGGNTFAFQQEKEFPDLFSVPFE